ncbi:MAG: YfiR family protein [Azoarcus sp.]|jgi:hypothetical protein|nr:YfiR family protein [Azoarcus sp.]
MTFTLIQGNARAASDSAAVTPVSKIVTVFWGIVSYTRWPGEKGPLRVCLPENNRQAMAIRDAAKVVKLGRRISVRTMPEKAESLCDVVYFSAMPADEVGPRLRRLAGAPILTIGEGRAFCSTGGMFCLFSGSGDGDTGEIAARFAANLDATARSPLRINPQVLRLSKRGRDQ